MPIEKKIIEASVARSGWIETEYAGRKAYIKITADED